LNVLFSSRLCRTKSSGIATYNASAILLSTRARSTAAECSSGFDILFSIARLRRLLKKAVSAEVAATRKLLGQNLAHLRRFPKTARSKFQKIARTKSREDAIAAMKKAVH
jgi:hypothetical protein